jgi:hypothetical protein
MKNLIPLALIVILLAGCGPFATAEPTPSDSALATKVAQILTTMPTATVPAVLPSSTAELPTLQPTSIDTAVVPSLVPTDTSTPVVPSSTLEPTAEPTLIPSPTLTATAAPDDPASRLGGADWVDDMNSDVNWPTGVDKYTAIAFRDGLMYLTGLTTTDGWRLAWPVITNFYLEMTFQTGNCSGADRYGMIARVPDATNPDRGYLFGISCDGQYSLRRWNASVGMDGEMVTLVKWTNSPVIKSGPNQTNTIGLMAIAGRLILYANGKLLTEVNDTTFQKGSFGVFVGARETEDFTVRVDRVRYWENPEQ